MNSHGGYCAKRHFQQSTESLCEKLIKTNGTDDA